MGSDVTAHHQPATTSNRPEENPAGESIQAKRQRLENLELTGLNMADDQAQVGRYSGGTIDDQHHQLDPDCAQGASYPCVLDGDGGSTTTRTTYYNHINQDHDHHMCQSGSRVDIASTNHSDSTTQPARLITTRTTSTLAPRSSIKTVSQLLERGPTQNQPPAP